MKPLPLIFGLLALLLAGVSVFQLESARGGLTITREVWDGTPVTTYQGASEGGDLVLVAHGFAGSRQMMEAISLTLARAGHRVVAFDFQGHGRHQTPLSPDITTLTGTTEDLVRQTLAIAEEARRVSGKTGLSLVGHSMATDVVIRAADRLEAVESVVAISMYSEAVRPDHPERLLVISGAQEGRLREVALNAVAQIGPAEEGVTATADDVERRAVAAPLVGHVGVLWAPFTKTEIASWVGETAEPARTGPWIGGLLGAILVLGWAAASLLPVTRDGAHGASVKRALLSAVVPAPFAVAASLLSLPLLGLAGFGALALFFGMWGVIGLTVLGKWPRLRLRPILIASMLLAVAGLGLFALALDRYGAAFLPTGPRFALALALVPSMLAYIAWDRTVIAGRGVALRVLLRLPFLLALGVAMGLNIPGMGLLFTVLPVFVLFLLVYGTMASWVEARLGPASAIPATGIILAWSIAASTPLFAG